ncbi:hypothetical protein TNCV_472691 [Trichonephila clavipes]|nr:hypothetical protein TNCV_472691 [Trichonephila clavipes]
MGVLQIVVEPLVPFGRLVEGEERWEAFDQPQGILPQNWGGTEQNRTVTCMMLKAKANDRHKNLALTHDEFHGLCNILRRLLQCLAKGGHSVAFRLRADVRVLKSSFDLIERGWLDESKNCWISWSKRCSDWTIMERVSSQQQISESEGQWSTERHNRVGGQTDCQRSCRSTRLVVINYLACGPHTCVKPNPPESLRSRDLYLSYLYRIQCISIRLQWCRARSM